MESWPLGVFASIDAGLGVCLEVAHELDVKTVHLHTPQQESRTEGQAREFLAQLQDIGITITCVFGGFEGESYADIPTVKETVGLVPLATRSARLAEMKEIADFARRLGVDVVGLHIGFVPHDRDDAGLPRDCRGRPGFVRPCSRSGSGDPSGNWPRAGRCLAPVSGRCRPQEPVH